MSFKFPFALALVASASLLGAPQTFRGGIHTVSVYATVVSKSGRLVPDLKKEDFDVFDNGKRQTLTLFKNDIQPITIVIMVDRSGSMVWSNDLIQTAVEQFIADLLPADKARLGGFSGRIDIAPPEFTSDHDELLQTLRGQQQDAGPTPLWNATAAAMDALANQKGRRVVLILSDSKDGPDPSDAKTSLATVTDRAQAEEIVVYAIGLTGRLRAPLPLPAPAFFQRGRGGGRGGTGPGGRGTLTGAPNPSSVATPDPGLKKLTVDSGGGYFELEPTDGFTSTFARIADELHRQYVLAFTAATLDGKMHTLKVNVHQADAIALVRKGYLATPDK